jgi:phage-related protein
MELLYSMVTKECGAAWRGAWIFQEDAETPAEDLDLARRRMKEMMA